jgi:hypothetical protein
MGPDQQQTKTTEIRLVEHSQCSKTSEEQEMATRHTRPPALGGAPRCSGDEELQRQLDAQTTVAQLLSRAQVTSN